MKNLSIVALGLILLLTSGCGEAPEPGDTANPVTLSLLRRGNGGEPATLDPFLAEDVHAFNVLGDIYEGLVTESADGSLLPGVARTWEVSEDGLRYTFFLRADATWSNGYPITADDFVASFRRTLSPGSQAPYAFLLSSIRNAAAVSAGEMDVGELGVRAIDSATLVIELASPTVYFPGILAMPIALPLHGQSQFDSRQFADPDWFVGNGAYVLKEWRLGSKIRLEKNPRFRGAEGVRVQSVEYFPIENPDTEYNMYRAGELDITATVPPSQIDNIRRTRPEELQVAPKLALYYIALDLTEPPMNNPVLRQALSMAIDREQLVELIGRGEYPAYGIVPSGVASYDGALVDWRNESHADRIKRAKALYEQAGYGFDRPLRFTLMYDTGDIHEMVALAVSAMWHDVLGADVALDKREWMYFLKTRNDRLAWQAMRFSWFGDYNDASTFLDIFRSDSAQNLSAYQDPEFDQLLDAAGQAQDPIARSEFMNQAESRLLQASPVIPLYFFVSKHLVSPRVRNFQPNILDAHRSQYVELTGVAQ